MVDEGRGLTSGGDSSEIAVASSENDGLAKRGIPSHSVSIPFNEVNEISAFIPLIGRAAETVEQYGRAVVKFPEGGSWSQLLNRKTPGWEGWKTLSRGGGKEPWGKQAAIKQAKISPAMATAVVFQIASFAVGQYYMAEISNEIKGLSVGIDVIQQILEADRKSEIKSTYQTLMRYVEDFDDYQNSPEKRQAALNALELQMDKINDIWNKHIELINSLSIELSSSKRFDEKSVREKIARLKELESSSEYVFQLILLRERISMQYDADFSEKRIKKVCGRIAEYVDAFNTVDDSAYKALNDKIDQLSSFPLAIPDELEDDEYSPDNKIDGFAHGAKRLAQRLKSQSWHQAARQQLEQKKDELHVAASAENQVDKIADRQEKELNDIDFIFNQANALLIEKNEIRWIKEEE